MPEIGAVVVPLGTLGTLGAVVSGVTETTGVPLGDAPTGGGVWVAGVGAGVASLELELARLVLLPEPPPPPQAARVLPNTAIAAIRIA
ncbi:MAG TPA: hypothetical protein DEP03_13715 [Massilia sp.]|nr:hypothetical protein [Massilia sp.]